jgi:RNA polymerase sigma factor (sigma-70 family)
LFLSFYLLKNTATFFDICIVIINKNFVGNMEVNKSGFWDAAYRDNAPALLGVLRRYVKDVNIARDLLHEVFIAAIDKYDGYAGKGSFEGWLYRIAVNTALMYLRNERNNPVETGHILSLHQLTDDDTDLTQADDARAAIEAAEFSGEELIAAIDRLPEHHKLVFNMYVMDDFSHRQIASELNISPGTSKSHLARARKKIQQILYDDAMHRKKKKDRRRVSAFLLLFPAKEHYIDRLYREGLSDFTIPPGCDMEFSAAAMKNSKIQGLGQAESLSRGIVESLNHGTSLWSYLAACCGTAAITGTVCWIAMSENSPVNRAHDVMNVEMTAGDTLMYSPKPPPEDSATFDAAISGDSDATHHVSTHESNDSAPLHEETAATTPVVVKKQIIQRQTVVVRDTVFIVE